MAGPSYIPWLAEPQLKEAAEMSLELWRRSSFCRQEGSGSYGVDLSVFNNRDGEGTIRVGMIECKVSLDPYRTESYQSPWKTVYTAVGQLMLHGRVSYPDLPLALFVGALGLDPSTQKPILSRDRGEKGREPLEQFVRRTFDALNIDLIVCARVGPDHYVLDGGEERFLKRVEEYIERKRGPRIVSGDD